MNRRTAGLGIIQLWVVGICMVSCALFVFAMPDPIDTSRLPTAATRQVDFAKDIQPILELACIRCHGSAMSMSNFRVDTRSGLLKGGDLGVDVLPGQSARSPLIHFVSRLVPESEMPPKGQGEALTSDQVALLRAWIDQGVQWPPAIVLQPPGQEPPVAAGRVASQPLAEPEPQTSSSLPPGVTRPVDFVKDIRPILAKKCYACHGPDQQGNQLRWDVKAIAVKGGLSGRAFVPGNSAGSLVIRLVGGLQPGLTMPLKGERLTPLEIGLLRGWIDQGAQWPDGLDPKDFTAQSVHWAYRPLAHPALPKIKPNAWCRSPIDQFVLAKLQEKGMRPSPLADKRTLLRRISFDLTGLPPSPEELRDFLADNSQDAYGRAVDQLLASPRYGERWARHWLDVVHYADSHGHDQDRPRDNAWPYRDYVIRAFNNDKPYARFVEEQLAGDILYPSQPEDVVATGFIATGPFDESSMLSIVDDTLDKKRAQTLDRDDMVMTTMSTFLSTTVHCARCHNHKFDPISQTEYYRLQAVFAGVDRADRPYDPDPALHVLRESLRKQRGALETSEKQVRESGENLNKPQLEAFDARTRKLEQELEDIQKQSPQAQSRTFGFQSQVSPQDGKNKWVQIDFGRTLPIDQVLLLPVQHANLRDFGFPSRFRVDLSNDPMFGTYHTIANHLEVSAERSGSAPLVIENIQLSARYLRITVPPPAAQEAGYWFFALAEVLAISGNKNVAAGCRVTSLDSVEDPPQWSRANLVDGNTSLTPLPAEVGSVVASGNLKAITALSQAWELELEIKQLKAEREKLADSLLSDELRSKLSEIREKLDEINRRLAALPPSQMVYAAASDFAPSGNFHPSKGIPRPIHVLRRGEITTPGELVTPGALSMIPGLSPEFKIRDMNNEGLRRAALAQWIVDPKNALTWRSIVNRVWSYHFGRGLVSTPNDFGRMGGVPSHPELLDWLAGWFLENGGSLKKLHRLILTSSVYLQSSQDKPEFSRVDSENQYLWRMNRFRLDAESVKDSILQITGKLDLKMGGPPVKQFVYDDPNPGVTPLIDYSHFDVDNPDNFRRSIYRYVFRTVTDPLMDSLDCPDASQLSPVRNVSITPLQALTMWNNHLIVRQAEHFATRVGTMGTELDDQIDAACELAWGRLPTPEETQKMLGYATKHGMANTCRVILNSNEFAFVN